MRKFKKVKNKGIVFWITGLSGSGKTQIGKKVKKDIIKKHWQGTIAVFRVEEGGALTKSARSSEMTPEEGQELKDDDLGLQN